MSTYRNGFCGTIGLSGELIMAKPMNGKEKVGEYARHVARSCARGFILGAAVAVITVGIPTALKAYQDEKDRQNGGSGGQK